MTTASPSDEDAIKNDHNLRAAYAAIAARAQSHRALRWQTPNLALVAEAFLLAIALGPQSTPMARLVASALNVMISLLCIQLMAKHREFQVRDRIALKELEGRLGLAEYHGKPDLDDLPLWKRLIRLSSTKLWIFGFAVLALVAVIILVVTLKAPGDLLEPCRSTF